MFNISSNCVRNVTNEELFKNTDRFFYKSKEIKNKYNLSEK